MCFDFLYSFTRNISHFKKIQRDIVKNMHKSTGYSSQIKKKKNLNCSIDFRKQSNIKFYENPSSGRRVVCADGRTDITKLLIAFRNFANMPKTVTKLLLISKKCYKAIKSKKKKTY
jgi:hypothetical protein